MTTVHVGLPVLHGEIARYAQKFDLLEVRPVDTPLPKASRLAKWRKEVPPAFVFSVVLPSIVTELRTGDDGAKALATALDVSAALEARCIVIPTPVSVTPTALNKKRLAALIAKLPADAVTLAWEPRGIWDVAEAGRFAKELGIQLVVDAALEKPPRGAVMYTRLRGLGVSTRLGPSGLERVRAAIAGRREVYVIVESNAPMRVAEALRRPIEGPPRMTTGSVVRPLVRISAEDEEQ
jgi:uncharacterized protein YecE (DUF72 family)